MLWLPELTESGLSLPLSLGAAPALAAALASGPRPEVIAALAEALGEPSLAVWTVHRAWSLGCVEIRTVAAAAEWLARHARTVLDWGDAESIRADDGRLADEYLRLTKTSLRAAALARDGARNGEMAHEADCAYWLGLLHATERWWRLAGERRGDGAVAASPPWLSEALAQLSNVAAETSGAIRLVGQALQAASGHDSDCHPAENNRSASSGMESLAASLPLLAVLARRQSQVDSDELETAKLEAMAEFAAGAGHEINNPLAVIAGRAQLLLDGEPNAQRRRELAVIHAQAMRVHEMIADMMLFARPPRPKLARCDVRDVLREVVSEIGPKAADKNVAVSLELPDQFVSVEADANQLAVAVRAICDNALSAVDRGGRIELRLESSADASTDARSVTIVIADNGSGIPPEVRCHIFDPFYSGRQAGRGLGMGLAKAWRIVRNHRGRLEVDSRPGRGSAFRIVIPASASPPLSRQETVL